MQRDYAPLRDYAAIGDGRTAALVARDGSIDWLCLPTLDSPSVFGAILDRDRGGSFMLEPEVPYDVARRYLPDTNLLETTFTTGGGATRVTDAMTLPGEGLAPERELVRRVEGLSGRVPLRWRVEPRFGYGAQGPRIEQRGEVPVATMGGEALAVCAWSAGDHQYGRDSVSGRFEVSAGEQALIAIASAHGEPLVLPGRSQVERRLADTERFWRTWAVGRTYDGPWRGAVLRSALALKLLVFAPSGAIAAAATTSLPESVGGERNWDYRFSWVRDSAFTLDAFLELGCPGEATAFFWWLMHASQLTHPTLHVLYRLDGGPSPAEAELDLSGYRGSGPVRVGNAAARQRQLDVYGELFQTCWLYTRAGGRLDADLGRRLGEIADLVCELWRRPDSGIWEVRSKPVHFTQSKVACWTALRQAAGLAEEGWIPARGVRRWRAEAEAIRRFVEERCWSEQKRSYVRFAGSEELDASLLLAVLMGYEDSSDRLVSTVEAVRRELGSGPLLYRYTGEDGLSGGEGFFLACSFWLVDALARCGRLHEAAETMEELLAIANDVGLYAEEVEARTGEFLGNFPQGLVHLALINAAVSISEAPAT
ncbi:MAG: glycoside hydrolase family 15 protein [Solirubrobacterales bacterium]